MLMGAMTHDVALTLNVAAAEARQRIEKEIDRCLIELDRLANKGEIGRASQEYCAALLGRGPELRDNTDEDRLRTLLGVARGGIRRRPPQAYLREWSPAPSSAEPARRAAEKKAHEEQERRAAEKKAREEQERRIASETFPNPIPPAPPAQRAPPPVAPPVGAMN